MLHKPVSHVPYVSCSRPTGHLRLFPLCSENVPRIQSSKSSPSVIFLDRFVTHRHTLSEHHRSGREQSP